ncbi:YjfB family protein [Roseateles sp.]|uniref:YjfB family protein n=1 Tax=Roseateles sp. TaxID=1971397 RepID=UPI003BA50AC9
MDLSNTSLVKQAGSATPGSVQNEVQLTVLKKAMKLQEQGIMELLNAVPPSPPLASSGSLGTRLNTYA